jgi:hypothetical protein
MSRFARFYIFAGLLAILLMFVALAMSGYFSRWEPPYKVKNFEVKAVGP